MTKIDHSAFERFCGSSPFWNSDLLLNSDYPHFTKCFREVGFVWIPCLAFLLGGVVPYFLYLRKQTISPLPNTFTNVSRRLCPIVLALLSVTSIINKATDTNKEGYSPDAFYVSEALKALCFILCAGLHQMCFHRSKSRSLILWLFWLVMTLSAIVPFYSIIIEYYDRSVDATFIVFFMYFTILATEFVLNCFSDKPRYRNLLLVKNSSPEPLASVPILLTFSWITGLLWKCLRRLKLKENDVFVLPLSDRCEATVPVFEKLWGLEQQRVNEINEQRTPKVRMSSQPIPLIQLNTKGGENEQTYIGKENSPPPKPSPSLVRVIFKAYGPKMFPVLVGNICGDLLVFLTPFLTEVLLTTMADPEEDQKWHVFVLALAFVVVILTSSVIKNMMLHWALRIGMQLKGIMMMTIYKKSLTISSHSDLSKCKIASYMSNMQEIPSTLLLLLSAPIQLLVGSYLLYRQLGPFAYYLVFGMFLILAFMKYCIFTQYQKYEQYALVKKNERVKVFTEVLNGIKILKMYAWEAPFQEKLEAIKSKELKFWRICQIANAFMCDFHPIPIMALISFGVYISSPDNGYLSPTVAFVSLQLFEIISSSCQILCQRSFYETKNTLSQISEFLKMEDVDPGLVTVNPAAENAIEIENGVFSYKDEEEPTLKNINLKIAKGSLVAVVGSEGSGKSSLLSAVLGEMDKLNGTIVIKNPVAYVPQHAWVQNDTVRNNILFGKLYKEHQYNKVIEACGLSSDLDALPEKDRTEIGGEDISLSEDQKQRVSLARAVYSMYSDREIFLLEDPLSAMDSDVSKHIFDKVIGPSGLLKNEFVGLVEKSVVSRKKAGVKMAAELEVSGNSINSFCVHTNKTRVLVTDEIKWLRKVDKIFVLEDGELTAAGTLDELLSQGCFCEGSLVQKDENRKAFSEKLEPGERFVKPSSTGGEQSQGTRKRALKKRKAEGKKKLSTTKESEKASNNDKDDSEVKETEIHLGEPLESEESLNEEKKEEKIEIEIVIGPTVVGLQMAIKFLLQSIGLNCAFFVLLSCLLIGSICFSVFSGIWLAHWTDNSFLYERNSINFTESTEIYTFQVYAAMCAAQVIMIIVFAILWAVRNKPGGEKLHKVMLTKVLRAPMSFLETTPSKRIFNRFFIDVNIINYELSDVMKKWLIGASNVIVSGCLIIYAPILLAVLVPLAAVFFFLQHMYVLTSEQLRHFDEKTEESIYINLFETLTGIESIRAYKCQNRFIRKFMQNIDHNLKFHFAKDVTDMWLKFVLQLLGSIAIFSFVLLLNLPGYTGLFITYAVLMIRILEQWTHSMTELQAKMNIVKRVRESAEMDTEAPLYNPNSHLDLTWPNSGEVTFDNFETNSRPDLDFALKGISCQIKGGEKVGIVSNTGKYNSLISASLFRFIEAATGKIVIDGVDISTLGLHDLRRKLTVLPQDSVLFTGPLRMNLDPFNEYTDNDIFEVLEHAHLKDFVSSLPGGLECECGEGGKKLNVSQQRLVSLARTLLRKTKILILKEPASTEDAETDELIQRIVRDKFENTTILTFSNRLDTVLDCDRVLVLDNGTIKEFDSPQTLLDDSTTLFYKMAEEAAIGCDQMKETKRKIKIKRKGHRE